MEELRDQLELMGDWDHEESEEEQDYEQHEEEEEEQEAAHHSASGASTARTNNEQQEQEEEGVFADDCGPDDLTCAICLGQIQPLDLALVKGCEHQYCVHCILQWAMLKEWCPQCKAPFSYLFTHRHLDGTPSDYPLEESVTLLKRARWFTEEQEAREKARALAAAGARRGVTRVEVGVDDTERYHGVEHDGDAPPSPRDWCDFYEDLVDAELEEDEAIEEYYYSSAAGRARIVLGNRRWGGGGYMRNGRMYARPVNPAAASGSGGASTSASAGSSAPAARTSPSSVTNNKAAAGKGKQAVAATAATAAAAITPESVNNGKGKGRAAAPLPTPSPNTACPPRPKILKAAAARDPWADAAPALAASPLGRSPCSYGSASGGSWMAHAAGLGTSPGTPVGSAPGSGRRAKRNARRAAADVGGSEGERGGGGVTAAAVGAAIDSAA